MRCPASVQMTADLADTPSAAAEEGTIAHRWLERALTSWIATGDDDFECDNPEMKENLEPVFDYIIDRYETMPGESKMIELEQRVDLHYMVGRDDLWGSADVILSSTEVIDVIDLKYGKGVFVEAGTSQNKIYGLGCMAKYMQKSKGEIPWSEINLTIAQPRYPGSDGSIIRTEEWTPGDLLDWCTEELIPAAEASDNPLSEPIAGTKQCQWCRAKSTCPAISARVDDLCSVFEPVVNGNPGTTVATGIMRTPDEMDIDELIEVHDNEAFILGYLKAVGQQLRTLLEARDPRLKGKLKLVRSRRTNKWNMDQDDLLAELTVGKDRVPKKDLVVENVISAPVALKLSALSAKQKARMQTYITKSEGTLSIVPDGDPRDNEFPVLTFEVVDSLVDETDTSFDFL
jgi:hypothetical protein